MPDPTATKYAAYLAIHRTAGTTPRSYADWRGEYERAQYALTAQQVNTAVEDWSPPTEAQKEAGNYRKPTINWNGLRIKIENPRGTKRRPEWKPLAHHYGYIARTEDRDGDAVDCYIGHHPESEIVFVVDQEHPGGRFDEHKVCLAFRSVAEARKGYLDNYQDGWHCGPITAMTIDQFKAWLDRGNTKTRVAEQVSRYTADQEPTASWITGQYHSPVRDIAEGIARAFRETNHPTPIHIQEILDDPDRYARKHLKSSTGQQSLHFESAPPTGRHAWTEEDERKHPRAPDGEWAAKGEESKPDPKPQEPDTRLQDHVANLHDAMQEKLEAGKQFLARHAGKPLWISGGDHIRIADDGTTLEHTDPDGKWVRADLAQLDHWADKANIEPFTGPEGILTRKSTAAGHSAQDKAALPKEDPHGRKDPDPAPDQGTTGPRGRKTDPEPTAPTPKTKGDRPLAPGGREGPGDRVGLGQGGAPERLKGGKADARPDSDFDPEALAKGTKIEQEHTSDPQQAREIAKDHLTEDPKYYDKLEQMEEQDAGQRPNGDAKQDRDQGGDDATRPTADLPSGGPEGREPGPDGQGLGEDTPAADQDDADEPPQDSTQPEGPAGINEPYEPLDPEVPEIDDSEPPEEYLAHEPPGDLGERIRGGDATAADEVMRRLDEQYPEGTTGEKADRARAVRKKLVEDFGEKIGGARKDMARPLGPRGSSKKPDDDQPGWARRYHVGQITKSNRKEEEGQWAVYDTKQKSWHGQPRQIGVFPTKEEADRSIPLAEVARSHTVMEHRPRAPVATLDPGASATADQWLQQVSTKVRELQEQGSGLLLNKGITDRFRKALAAGQITQERFDELKTKGTIQSDEDYQKAQEIERQIQEARETPMPGGQPAGEQPGTTYAIVRKVSDRKHPVVKAGFASREEAMRYMAQHPEEIIEHQFPRYEQYQYLDHVQRQGGTPRAGNTTPADFHQEFGFRGGEFGNWQSGRDGQEALNHAHDALRDLADVLGVEPAGISLGGDLAIAFGARGTGGKDAARAHYEPGARVINLTKMRGAGTLAHEFAHALDNYFARQAKQPGERYGKYEWVTEGLPHRHNLRPEVADAWTHLVKSLMGKDEVRAVDPERVQKQKQYHWDHVKSRIDNLETSIAGDKRYNKRHKAFTPDQQAEWDATKAAILSGQAGEQQFVEGKSRFGGYQTYGNLAKLNQLYKAATGRSFHTATKGSLGQDLYWSIKASLEADKSLGEAQEGKTETKRRATNYYNAARDLDETRASSYYTIPTEMLARAFEAYCYDKLGAEGRKSDYLVGKAENKYYKMFDMAPFPEGDERQTINAAFDRLFSTMQQRPREDEKGQHVELYRAEPLRRLAKELYAAYLDRFEQARYSGTGSQIQAGNSPMNRYYRIQPAGSTLEHLSESSAGETKNLHVFESPLHAIHAQEHPTVYGDEVVEIEAPRHWDNQDVEGVAINPRQARLTRRWSLHDFPKAVYPFISNDVDELSDDVPMFHADHPAWHIAQNIENFYGDLDDHDRANEREIPRESS